MPVETSLLIVALAALGTMIAAVFNVWQIRVIHTLVNGRLTQLLNLTGTAARAEGLKEGRDNKK